jgi:hypothetical protein
MNSRSLVRMGGGGGARETRPARRTGGGGRGNGETVKKRERATRGKEREKKVNARRWWGLVRSGRPGRGRSEGQQGRGSPWAPTLHVALTSTCARPPPFTCGCGNYHRKQPMRFPSSSSSRPAPLAVVKIPCALSPHLIIDYCMGGRCQRVTQAKVTGVSRPAGVDRYIAEGGMLCCS